VLNRSRYISIIRAKQRKNRRKTKSRKRKRRKAGQPRVHGRATQDARPCATHHGQPVVGSIHPGPDASSTVRFVLFRCFDLGREFCQCWHFGHPLLSSLIHMALNFILSPITWLNSHESAIKTRKSQNKRNWKNRGINHINVHLNPLK